jgi:hypothetical protein
MPTEQYFPMPNGYSVYDPYSPKGTFSSREDRVDAQLNAEARMRLRPLSYSVSWQGCGDRGEVVCCVGYWLCVALVIDRIADC